jgi:hypothetical protein
MQADQTAGEDGEGASLQDGSIRKCFRDREVTTNSTDVNNNKTRIK